MESELRNLLDKIYELEGLVHLALKRDDSSEDFLRLISKKGKEIEEITVSLRVDEEISQPETQEALPFSFDEYSLDEAGEQNSFSKTEIIDQPLPLEAEIIEEEKARPLPLANEHEHENRKGKLVFSINERFRFRKELFDNSDADFNNTLALVASMENFEEAEDYFINEEGFDSKNPVVSEFMDVIKRYFK